MSPKGILHEEIRKATILIVEDEEANLHALTRLLGRSGYERTLGTGDPRRVLEYYLTREPDLILLDLHMPYMDGFEVMEALRPFVNPAEYLPILILTGDRDPQVKERALSMGAKDFVTKPFESTEVLLRIRNLLETRLLHRHLRDHNENLEEKVQERTRKLAQAQVEILHRLALAAEYRDDVTGQHAERVGVLSSLLARELGADPEDVALIRRAAPLHDVGKIGVPDAILMKPGVLTPQEFEVMKSHTEIGVRILSGSSFPLLQMAAEIAGNHHERWDGGGYRGLVGGQTPWVGRVVAVADVFDSLTHERPYKRAFPVEEAISAIHHGRGSHFDPNVVDAFMAVVERGGLEALEDHRVQEERREQVTSGSLNPGMLELLMQRI